ncbi:MAG: 50S ribosomal protein L5 [Candidatus Dojkabacteria bacterium]
MTRLQELYNKEIRAALKTELNAPNLMAVPKITKIVVNSGVGEATTNSAALDEMSEIIGIITGQKPTVRKSKKAVSAFKLREGMEVGVAVTLRGDLMWEFFDKLINVVVPRTKDFRGLSAKAFDGRGNYALGISEHTVFPEIDTSRVQKIRGLQIIIVTSAKDNNEARVLLDKFGFPFVKDGK